MALLTDGAYSIGKANISKEEFKRFFRIVDKNRDGKVSKR
jgi:hypothetical protein